MVFNHTLCRKFFAELPISAELPLVLSSFLYHMVELYGGVGRISNFAGANYFTVIREAVLNTDVAVAFGPTTFVLQILFGGLYITQRNVPKWAAWLPKNFHYPARIVPFNCLSAFLIPKLKKHRLQ